MKSTHMISTPATGLSSFVARERSCTSPNLVGNGTALSFAGSSAAAAQAVLADVRSTDLTGLVPRGAPV